MKITKSKLDDTSVTSSNVMKLPTDADSTIKSDPKELDTESKADSLNDMITSAQKELFELTPPPKVDNDTITLATSKSKKWVPIKSVVKSTTPSTTHKKTTPTIDLTEPSNCWGAMFAVDTNFKEREAQVAKRTPGKGTTLDDELKECVAQIRIKILPGAEDIQETVLGLMQHCLTILQERDDTACFLKTAKSMVAKKLMDFPCDFTDFHDNWGVCNEPMKSFLNTMPKGKGRSFTGSFHFRSKWEANKLFEKTLLKMAAATKIKGTISIAVKLCQCLDTERAVIFFNVPYCSASSLQQLLRKAMVEQKSRLIQCHSDKWPRTEWGHPLPQFEMIQDFVRNMPWRNREEKTTIQAYHKLAWHLECPTKEEDCVYKLLKAMKTNKTLYCLLAESATILCAPGLLAGAELRKMLATAVNFHTSFQMCIIHVPLHGLVDPDKAVKLVCIEDEDRDVQDAARLTMHQVLFSHKVNRLPLWQSIVQNDDGSWRGYYSNGKDCHNHKDVTTTWSGSIGAHLKFHLLKRGVTEESALKLIRASCSTQSLHDAISATFKDGKVVSAAQAELDDKLEEMQKRASWVDITVGMEALERQEYETERSGTINLLDPSDPRALNFADEQSVKTFSSKAAGTAYTVGVQESLGDNEFMPASNDIDSQESDLFGGYENDGFIKDQFHNEDGGIIANMDLLRGDGPNNTADAAEARDTEDMVDGQNDGNLGKGAATISSPKKITRKATNFDDIPNEPSAG
jgi:hypothetical protein